LIILKRFDTFSLASLIKVKDAVIVGVPVKIYLIGEIGREIMI